MTVRKFFSFIGDSLTHSNAYGCTAYQEYPSQVQVNLQAAGNDRVRSRNFGIAGNTTADMLYRIAAAYQFEVPELFSFYGGTNDRGIAGTGNAGTVNGGGATTTVIPLQTGQGAGLYSSSNVIINGESRIVQSVATDTITLTAPLTSAPANTTPVYHDTRKNIVAACTALYAQGTRKFVVVGSHYLNWTTGGDTTSSQNSAYQVNRMLQSGAVSDLVAQGVDAIYSDTYSFMRARILAGVDVQGSNTYHAFDDNQHLSVYGQYVVGLSETASITAKGSAWSADWSTPL